MTEQRRVGVPYGREQYIERIERTVHADGTVTDTEPTRTHTKGALVNFACALTRESAASGTKRVLLQRTVVTEATAWTEVPSDGPDPAGDVRGD